jgi:hypothetical protein
MTIFSPVDLLPGREIDARRILLFGIHNGETLSELSGLDELTSADVFGRLLYAVEGASFKPWFRTIETSENTELLRTASRRSSQNSPSTHAACHKSPEILRGALVGFVGLVILPKAVFSASYIITHARR